VSRDDRGPDTIRGTYRALLLRGLGPVEAANVTGHLHGLPSAGIRWTVDEVEAIVRRRAAHVRLNALDGDLAAPTHDTDFGQLTIASPLPWNRS
jgi:hypothetical protein